MDDRLDELIARLDTVEAEQARRMRVAWEMEDAGRRRDAWARARDALAAAGREGEIIRIREVANRWAGDRAFDINDLYGGGSREGTRGDARRLALPAVMDHLLATVAADLLDVDDRYLLSKPFRTGLTGEMRRTPALRATRGRSSPGRRPAP